MKVNGFKYDYLSCTECDFHLYSTPDTDYKYDWRCKRCGYECNSGFTIHEFPKNYLEDNFTFPIPQKLVPNKYYIFENEIEKMGLTWLKIHRGGVWSYEYHIKANDYKHGRKIYDTLFDFIQDIVQPFRFDWPTYMPVSNRDTPWDGSYAVCFVMRAEHVRRTGRELTVSDTNLED
jgi:hypothetical protein